MAIIKLGALVAGIRGTIGGVTFSAGPSGPFARLWSRGPTPQTEAALIVRGLISHLGAPWAGMTDQQRQDWTDFGLAPPETDTNSLGEIYFLTGWQWFVRVNRRRQSVGLPITTTVPTASGVAAPLTAVLTATALPAGAVEISWTADDIPAGYSALVYLGAHPSIGLASKTTQLVQVLAYHEPPTDEADLTAAVLQRFGALGAGWKLWAYLHKLRDDGVRSPATMATCEVT